MSQHENRKNEEITATHIRLIDQDGQMKGVVNRNEALYIAEEEGLDLVEIQPNADIPVCKIMDYGKFRYEQQKKAAIAKKHQKQIETKEVQFRPVIGDHDYQTKLNHVREFLNAGNRVRLVVRMKGRERMNADLGKALAEKLLEDLAFDAQFDDNSVKLSNGEFLLLALPVLNKKLLNVNGVEKAKETLKTKKVDLESIDLEDEEDIVLEHRHKEIQLSKTHAEGAKLKEYTKNLGMK